MSAPRGRSTVGIGVNNEKESAAAALGRRGLDDRLDNMTNDIMKANRDLDTERVRCSNRRRRSDR